MEKPLEDFDPVACTCPMIFDGTRHFVAAHTCPVCVSWQRKMADLGVTEKKPDQLEKMQKRFKVRKAA